MSSCENKIICSKKDILLTYNDNTKIYHMNFNAVSNNFDLNNYLNFTLYKLIFNLNKDIVESIEIFDELSNSCNILILRIAS